MKSKLSTCLALCSIIFSLPCTANGMPASIETGEAISAPPLSSLAVSRIRIPITYVVCRHTYGNPPKTVETKHQIPNGSSVEDAKRIGVDKCVAAGAKIRAELDKEAGGPGKSRPKYPSIGNVIGGIERGYIEICIPFLKLSSVADDDLTATACDGELASAEEPRDPAIEALLNGELDPAHLTAEQVNSLKSEAVSEDYTAQSYTGIELPTTSK